MRKKIEDACEYKLRFEDKPKCMHVRDFVS